jgi:aspartate aminotransferase
MPSISDKSKILPASPIRKLVPFAEAAKKKGIKIYHLNIGQPDIETPEVFFNAVKNISLKVLDYSHSAGMESYRLKLIEYYKRFGIELDLSNLLVTCGGSEALEMAMFACFNEGDEVIIPEPYYANYNGFATLAGVKIVPVRSYIEDGFALPPISAFEEKITPRTKAVMICNPGNPTGYVYTMQELQALRKLVLEHDLFLLSDEVYREFCYGERPAISILKLEGLEKNAIVLDSISKRYSACGARIGSLVTRNKEVFDACMKMAQARLSPPSLGQIGAEAAVDTPEAYFIKVKNEYIARRNFLVDALNDIPGVFCPKPAGAFYAMVRLPVDDSDKFCQWCLEEFSLNNATVMMAPGSGFYSNPDYGKHEVRMAYVLNINDLKNAVECLRVALEKYPGRRPS